MSFKHGPLSCILPNSGNTLASSPILVCRRSHLTECYTSAREFGSILPIIAVGRFVLGRSFRPRDVSDSLKELVKQMVVL